MCRIFKKLFNKQQKNTISKDRLKHVNEGEWIKPCKANGNKYRLKGGGHGQKNIDIANMRNVEYNITKIYKNGVRTGNYPNHKDIYKHYSPNQTWFPKTWSEKDMKKAGEKIANDINIKLKSNGSKYGFYKGVCIGIYIKDNAITTIFPDKYHQDKRRKRNVHI